jgi:hypothetical protein
LTQEAPDNRIELKKMYSDILNYDDLGEEMKISDLYIKFIALSITVNEDREFDKFDEEINKPLPWDKNMYKRKMDYKTYRQENLPSWLTCKYLSNVLYNISATSQFRVKLKKFCPLVFYHLRKFDKLTNDDLLFSLDPDLNRDSLMNSFAEGGRSGSFILFTHDKKYLLKLTTNDELTTLFKFLPSYHHKMKYSQSLLCRIYGIYTLKHGQKKKVNLILMKNMCELPLEVFIA